MLSLSNKDIIRNDIILKEYTIEGLEIPFTCIYENQWISIQDKAKVYPALILKYTPIGRVFTDITGDHISETMLTITVLSKTNGIDDRLNGGPYINGQVLVESVAQELKDHIEANFESYLDGVSLSGAISIEDTTQVTSVKHVYAMQLEVNILYEENKQ